MTFAWSAEHIFISWINTSSPDAFHTTHKSHNEQKKRDKKELETRGGKHSDEKWKNKKQDKMNQANHCRRKDRHLSNEQAKGHPASSLSFQAQSQQFFCKSENDRQYSHESHISFFSVYYSHSRKKTNKKLHSQNHPISTDKQINRHDVWGLHEGDL